VIGAGNFSQGAKVAGGSHNPAPVGSTPTPASNFAGNGGSHASRAVEETGAAGLGTIGGIVTNPPSSLREARPLSAETLSAEGLKDPGAGACRVGAAVPELPGAEASGWCRLNTGDWPGGSASARPTGAGRRLFFVPARMGSRPTAMVGACPSAPLSA